MPAKCGCIFTPKHKGLANRGKFCYNIVKVIRYNKDTNMPKKRKTKKKSASSAPQHKLPAGFWQQVTALCLIAFSILLIVAWFGVGGPVLEWVQVTSLSVVGYTVYVLPFLLTYLGVEIFRVEKNKLPLTVKIGAILLVLWFAGFFGLFGSETLRYGGWIGDNLNGMMNQLVDGPVAGFIYILLIFVTFTWVASISIKDLFVSLWHLVQAEEFDDKNVKIMKTAASDGKDAVRPEPEFKVNVAGGSFMSKFGKKSGGKSDSDKSSDNDKSNSKPEEQTALVALNDPNWVQPGLDLLESHENPPDPGNVDDRKNIIRSTFAEFAINVAMTGANVGPKVTQYTLSPPSGVKLSRITQLDTNLALNLAAKTIRIEAPIPGQSAVGIEVPNVKSADVRMRPILEDKAWTSNHEPLSFVIGRDIAGVPIIGELNRMPHLLIAGQTNSGKSVMINTLLTSLLYRNSPSRMKLILVDPKQVEMSRYNDIPHLLTPIITKADKTLSALKWAVQEMDRRYKLLSEVGEVNIQDYNRSLGSPRKKIPVKDEKGNIQEHDAKEGAMPYIVIVIDEMADLMMEASKEVETLIIRIAQKARAVGIHLVLATQSPRADVITGLIKANIPAKIAFTVGNNMESRIILDQVGAEKLLGQGDMLYKTATMSKPARVQGAWVENKEVKKITDHLREQSPPQYDDEVISQHVELKGRGGMVTDSSDDYNDPKYLETVRYVIDAGQGSASTLQRRFKLGYNKAARYIDMMEDQSIVGPKNGSKPREVLVSSFEDAMGMNSDDDLDA